MSAHSSGVAFSLRSRSLACGRLRSPAVACGRLRSPAVACLRTQWRQKAAISPRFGWTGDFCGVRSACVGCLGCLGDCEKRRAVLFVLQDVFGPLLGIFTLIYRYMYVMSPYRAHKSMLARGAPAGRCGHLRCLLAPPGCRVELGRRWAGLGWSNSTSIDRGRARRTGTR